MRESKLKAEKRRVKRVKNEGIDHVLFAQLLRELQVRKGRVLQ